MAKYISRKHYIEAFQFIGHGTKIPQWFRDAVHEGRASFTINDKTKHVTIYGNQQEEHAHLYDWVCLSKHGKMYALDCDVFASDYCAVDENS